jgi:hypothetical protein
VEWVRIGIIVLLVAHGLGHSIWVIGSWVPSATMVAEGRWLVLRGDPATHGPVGRALGLLALAALVLFLAAAIGLWQRLDWWVPVTIVGSFVSLAAVVPWGRRSPGTTTLNAAAADVLLLIAAVGFGSGLTTA